MNELLIHLFDISMLIFVSGSMITLGLNLTFKQFIAPFKKIRMIIRALIANFILVPVFAYALLSGLEPLFPISEGLKTGIILLALTGGAPFIPKVVEVAKAQMADGVGLMLLLMIVTMIIMPLAIPIIFHGASISSFDIIQSLLYSMFIPLILALFYKARFAESAMRIQPYAAKITSLSILILFISAVILYSEIIIDNRGALPIILLFFLGSMMIGYLAGGKISNARIIFSIGTGLRNPPIAVLVASKSFSNEPMAAIVPLLVIIIGLSILFPLAVMIRKKAING